MRRPTLSRGLLRTLCAVILFGSWLGAAWAFAETDAETLVRQGTKALYGWQMDEAAAIAAELEKRKIETPEALFFLGHLAFYRGDYVSALDHVNGAGDYTPRDGFSYDYRPFLQNAHAITRDFVRRQSENFEIRYRDDKEVILVDAALETLEKAREALGQELGYRPSGRIVVEMYPELDHLARATGLTLSNLHTSGVIAICKFNRLMVTSPRVSPYGYGWRDTLSHEFVHLLIMHLSRNTVPVWLHEGIAKYLEERWRQPGRSNLPATSESLLARALREDKLVTLEQIHPSMAYLPSQEHTALAFAEVMTMVEWLAQLRRDGIRQILVTLPANGGDLDRTFREIYGFDAKGLENGWKRHMKQRGLKELDYALKDYEILFGEEGGDSDDKLIQQMEQRRGRKFMTLGKLLKDRGKLKAATMEFDKARQTVGPHNVLLQNLIADAYLGLELHQQAAEALKPVIDLAPGYLPSRLRLGRAYFGMGNFEAALTELIAAFGINPFDPRVHSLLAAVYDKLNQPDEARRSRRNLELLGGAR